MGVRLCGGALAPCPLNSMAIVYRIREAMKDDGAEPMGGEGKTVEMDETYQGVRANRTKARAGSGHKRAVVSLVERGGKVRSFHVDNVTVSQVIKIADENADKASTLATDESKLYSALGREFDAHKTVHHKSGEYVRGTAHTNTIEGFFSIFKRGMKGVYQHCDERHLHRYLAEFDFRYSNRAKLGVSDTERATKAVKGIEGKTPDLSAD